jgi:hypothetical protein
MAMKKVGDIYTTLSERYNLHRSVVMEICAHPFRFTARRMADPEDERAIMIPYLCKVRMKRRMLGQKKDIAERTVERKTERYLNRQNERAKEGIEV